MRSALTSGGQQGLATAFTPDGRSMLTVGSNPQAAVWDVSHPSAPVRRASPTVHDKPIYRAAFTPDARILATADADGRVRVSDMSDPAHPATIAEFVAQVIAQVGSEGEIVKPWTCGSRSGLALPSPAFGPDVMVRPRPTIVTSFSGLSKPTASM